MKTICLSMIVKNEAHVIERCLESVKSYIDTYVICDTGSSDETIRKASKVLKGLDGQFTIEPWVDFAANRNKALELARLQNTDYILSIDADEVLKIIDNKKDFKANGYNIKIHCGDTEFYRPLILKSDFPWKYFGVLHEYISTEDKKTISHITNDIEIISLGDSHRNKSGKKYENDISLLLKGLDEDPSNPRYMFYLAESYKNSGQYKKAIKWYERRFVKDVFFPEQWLSLYYSGLCYDKLGDVTSAVLQWVKACKFKGGALRPEAFYQLARTHRERGDYELALHCAERAYQASKAKPLSWSLFVDKNIWNWRAADEYVTALFDKNELKKCIQICEEMLPNLPNDAEIERVYANILICQDLLKTNPAFVGAQSH